jgi:hypothetical protein
MTLLSHSLSPTTFFETIKVSNEKNFNKFVLKVQNANFLLVECRKFEVFFSDAPFKELH